MGDRLTLLPDLLAYASTQLDSDANTLRTTADELVSLENWASGTPGMGSASDHLLSARLTLTQTADGLSRLRGDVANRATLLGIRVPPPQPPPSPRPPTPATSSKNWWDVAWGNISSGVGKAWNWIEKNKDVIHTVLNVAGMIPIVGDVANAANALLYLGEGDYADAALSAVALIPLAADGILAARLGVRALGYVKDLGVAEKLLVEGENVTKVSLVAMSDTSEFAPTAEDVLRAAKGADLSNFPEVGATIEKLSNLDAVKNWGTFETDAQKLDALQQIENAHAEATLRDARPIVTDNPEVRGGAYDHNTKNIYVDRELLNKPQKEVIDTITHEGWHAFQGFWADQPENFREPELAQQWAENFKNYTKQDANPFKYFSQPLEATAGPYGEAIAKALFPEPPASTGPLEINL